MNRTTPVDLKIELTDIITPKLCSSYIAEIIKYVAFTKQQIPYPYERLKMFVLKRRERLKQNKVLSNNSEDLDCSNRVAFQMKKYFKKVEEAFEILDSTFKCIEQELNISREYPVEEVVLIFGATLASPKDVYRFKIPPLIHGHSDAQHMVKRQIANLFRGIIVSDEVNNNLQRKVGLTNMFVMLKTKKERSFNSEWLLPKDHYKLSERVQQVCFTFNTMSSAKPCSCLIEDNQFEDLSRSMAALRMSDSRLSSEKAPCESVPAEQFLWLQTPRSLKGFKDCKAQGISVSDFWYKHSFI